MKKLLQRVVYRCCHRCCLCGKRMYFTSKSVHDSCYREEMEIEMTGDEDWIDMDPDDLGEADIVDHI